MLLGEFFAQHVAENLAPKTAERYHEQAAYIDHSLLAMAFADITPLHLNREWKRLLACGGYHRRTKAPRPLSKKNSPEYRRRPLQRIFTRDQVGPPCCESGD